MGRHAETRDRLHLEFEIGVNQVIIKDTADLQAYRWFIHDIGRNTKVLNGSS